MKNSEKIAEFLVQWQLDYSKSILEKLLSVAEGANLFGFVHIPKARPKPNLNHRIAS